MMLPLFPSNAHCRLLTCLLFLACSGQGVAQPAETLFQTHCAFCHTGAEDSRVPSLATLSGYSPEAIIRALTDGGAMRAQGYLLSGEQRRELAEFITGRPLADAGLISTTGLCESPMSLTATSDRPQWNGWGPDVSNSHFQPASAAGLTVEQIPGLELKWAFGFQDAASAWGQPTVVDGKLFVGSQSGTVFALDAATGCQFWAFSALSGVRTAITLVEEGGRQLAIFGDMSGNAYAIDASTGTQVWVQEADAHPLARITGSPAVHEGRIYVPISSFEESQGGLEDYPCCTFRGSVTALDLASGRILWKTYTVDEPREQGAKANGVKRFGPAGGAIWSAPTVDAARHRIYVAVGNAYAEPQPATTDAVLALDMETGRLLWSMQTTPEDIYVTGCTRGDNCPREQETGPDVDFGTSPVLARTRMGRELIVVGQKSGVAYAMDPDREGAVVWQYRAGEGGAMGGIQWGLAVDDSVAYIPVSDLYRDNPGGLHAVSLATGEQRWFARPPALLCGEPGRGCSAALSAAITVIPGAVFVGSVDGGFRAYDSADGNLVWEYDTNREFSTVNGVSARGASLMGPGPVVVDGMVFVNSGYGALGGRDGNVLLGFGLPDPN